MLYLLSRLLSRRGKQRLCSWSKSWNRVRWLIDLAKPSDVSLVWSGHLCTCLSRSGIRITLSKGVATMFWYICMHDTSLNVLAAPLLFTNTECWSLHSKPSDLDLDLLAIRIILLVFKAHFTFHRPINVLRNCAVRAKMTALLDAVTINLHLQLLSSPLWVLFGSQCDSGNSTLLDLDDTNCSRWDFAHGRFVQWTRRFHRVSVSKTYLSWTRTVSKW